MISVFMKVFSGLKSIVAYGRDLVSSTMHCLGHMMVVSFSILVRTTFGMQEKMVYISHMIQLLPH
ncbi:unnamed protein product [Brassica oleracea var. botrytis]